MSAQPTDIQWKKKSNCLFLRFGDGVEGFLGAEFLRVNSPSAEVQGHGTPVLQVGKRDVRLAGVEPIGNYAIRLSFDDGHDSGLFSWGLLYRFLQNHETLWQSYLERLQQAGASRKPGAAQGAQPWEP